MISFLVRHRATVLLVVGCIFIFGLLTYTALPREAAPDV
jgi:multidrug efflux pump subunit AcrB